MTAQEEKLYDVNLAEALAQMLRREGVTKVFGICGGYLSLFLNALQRAGITTVTNRHEGAAACAAAAYSQASGELAVVFTTGGPGTTNAVSGIAAAYADNVPMLVIPAQTPRGMYAADAHQEAHGANVGEIDQLAVTKPAAAATFRPPTPGAALRSMQRALAISICDRVPTVVELASDLFGERVQVRDLPPSAYRPEPNRVDLAAVEKLAAMIAEAKRPVLLIGNRASHRGISEEIVAFVEENDLVCATVDFAKGSISEDHPLSVGVLGQAGQDAATEAVDDSDLVVALGVRMTWQTTLVYRSHLFKNLVQIDVEPADIGRNFPVLHGVVGDIPPTLRVLREAMQRRGGRGKDATGAAARVAALRTKHRVYDEERSLGPVDEPCNTPTALRALRAALPREAIVVGDSGLTNQLLKRHFPVYAKEGFFNLYGTAAMGPGLPVGLGVQVARPDATVVSVIGDGAFLVHTSELQVLSEHSIPLIVVVVNNASYKQVEDRMTTFLGDSYGCTIQEIDAAAIGRGFGCDGFTARTASELIAVVEKALSSRRPTVIDLKVRGDHLMDITPSEVKNLNKKMFGDIPQGFPFPAPK